MQAKANKIKLVVTITLLVGLYGALLLRGNYMQREKEKNGKASVTLTPTPELPQNLSNVWLIEAEGKKAKVYYEDREYEYELAAPLRTKLESCIVDITVEKGKITALMVQKDTIEAKVLRIGEDFLELEGYGVLELEEESRVYRMYGELAELSWEDVLVGYTTSSFVLSNNKVCAALVLKPVEVTFIRVLLQSASYGGYYHEILECGSETGFYISDGIERTEWKEAGERIAVTPELVEEYGGRVYLGTEKGEGKISLYNVTRAVGVPAYRGSIEIAVTDGKLLVINELSLEEYLYGVLPSEMPESFGAEALKAQAVCARSYACNQLMANRYRTFGAHVDDSMNCQVYQNYGETDGAVDAVDATFGKVLSRNGESITAYYFSCSYGHTSDSRDIWGENTGTLFEGVPQAKEKKVPDLSDSENFEEFLYSDREWYDEESVWFRWSTVLGKELDGQILKRLQERQKEVPDMILVKTSQNDNEMRFIQGEITKFGTLQDIIVAERGDSGVITKLILVGSEATYLIQKEYNIRYILAPINVVYLKDGTTSSNMNLLPSAYFTVKKEANYFTIAGGGHGHGAGMSQYGAKYLAAKGWNYEEILVHYYQETEITYLYNQ